MTHNTLKNYNKEYLNKSYLEIIFYGEKKETVEVVYGEIDIKELATIKHSSIDYDNINDEVKRNITYSKSFLTRFIDEFTPDINNNGVFNEYNHTESNNDEISTLGCEGQLCLEPIGGGGDDGGDTGDDGEPVEPLYANFNKTVELNEYDDDTYTDYFENQYVDNFDNTCSSTSEPDVDYLFDDPIVDDIIPKELFTNIGTYTYVGDEYGYYIDTKIDYLHEADDTLKTDVLVFDIEKTIPANLMENDASVSNAEADYGYVNIKPLFRYKYQTLFNPNDGVWQEYKCGWPVEVYDKYAPYVRLHQDYDDISINFTRPGISIDLLNVGGEPNQGEDGYDMDTDYGAIISNIQVSEYHSYLYTITEDSRGRAIANYLFGLIPFKSKIKEGIDLVKFLYEFQNSRGEYEYKTYYTVTEDDINFLNSRGRQKLPEKEGGYGTLIKNAKLIQSPFTYEVPEDESSPAVPIIYDPFHQDYVRFRYELAGGEPYDFDTKVSIGVHVEIADKNPYYEEGDPIEEYSIILDQAVGTYYGTRELLYGESSSKTVNVIGRHPKVMNLNTNYEYILDKNELIYIKYSPDFTGIYTIETTNYSTDTKISIFYRENILNPQTGLEWALFRYKFDDNSGNGNCSKIFAELEAGKTYFIMVENNEYANEQQINLIIKK